MPDLIAPTACAEASWLSLPLALGPWSERLTGANHQPMLYVATDDRYIRLSDGAAHLLDALDGETTAAEILERVPEPRRMNVLKVIDGLRTAGAFTVSRGHDPVAGRVRPRRFPSAPRLRLSRNIDAAVARPAALATRHPRVTRVTLAVLGLAGLSSLALGVAHFPHRIQIMWPAVLAALLLELTVHELAHAGVCRVYGIRVKEAGVMLWGWFLPLAYVDCTDLYRLPGRRPRVVVALAGPFVDVVAAGAAAAIALATRGETSGTAFMVLIGLLLVLTRNLTPLLPTDGYFALEAATGELNLRRRAWSHLCATLAGRGTAQGPRTRRERIYLAYAALAALYTAVLVVLVVAELRVAIGALG